MQQQVSVAFPTKKCRPSSIVCAFQCSVFIVMLALWVVQTSVVVISETNAPFKSSKPSMKTSGRASPRSGQEEPIVSLGRCLVKSRHTWYLVPGTRGTRYCQTSIATASREYHTKSYHASIVTCCSLLQYLYFFYTPL